jgi:radical SAM superfamily enzyme YgiQ (UPF0313 family)
MDTTNKKGPVMLVAFYNTKALGVRYLEAALEKEGYEVYTVFYKDFNSVRPQVTTESELGLLCDRISQVKPLLIGLSVMSSMYIETVDAVIQAIKRMFDIPTVCGGAFASMFPERFLDRGIEYVIRCDGERAICRLADAIGEGADVSSVPSLCFRSEKGTVTNSVGDVANSLDDYGIPAVVSKNACFIENNSVTEGDPQLHAATYELVASRGCPFTCSYCCCVNLRRLMPGGTPPVRTRSVKNVIGELTLAKSLLKRVVYIHFYDEVFPSSPDWINDFVDQYQKQICLPFNIFGHPKLVNANILKKLVSAGLTEVIMGIQSGSPLIRRDVFHRYETQDDILSAARKIREAGVAGVVYDFMLQHPFETIGSMKETFNLIAEFNPPFELQLHGLNFLPGTDIVAMAIDGGYLSQEEMDGIMYAPMQRQFDTYWKRESSPESRLWYELIYCLQFPSLRHRVRLYAADPLKYRALIDNAYSHATKLFRLRRLGKKVRIVLKSKIAVLS